MPLAPMPDDKVIHELGAFSRPWNVWFNNAKNLINFGEPPSKNTDITAAVGIQLLSPKMRIQSVTAGAIIITADPQISPGYDGQEITIQGLDNVKTVQIADGTGIKLIGASPFIFDQYAIMKFHFNKSDNLWIEISRNK